MARVSKRWRLNIYATPTEARPSEAHVAEALYALQVDATPAEVRELTADPGAGAVVAIVKHLARANGSYLAVEIDGPSLLDDQEPSPASLRDEEE